MAWLVNGGRVYFDTPTAWEAIEVPVLQALVPWFESLREDAEP